MKDIAPLGSGSGSLGYWVKSSTLWGDVVATNDRFVVIDAALKVTWTSQRRPLTKESLTLAQARADRASGGRLGTAV